MSASLSTAETLSLIKSSLVLSSVDSVDDIDGTASSVVHGSLRNSEMQRSLFSDMPSQTSVL